MSKESKILETKIPHSLKLDVLQADINKGLKERIAHFQKEIDKSPYKVSAGCEDEFYVFGTDANEFEKLHAKELRATFPLIDRIYQEADALLLGGTKLRLGLPNMRKWEITTNHKDANGAPISIAEQVNVLNDIRAYMVSKQKAWGLIVDYTARPIPDISQSIAGGFLPRKITDTKLMVSLPKQLPVTDLQALRYLQDQIRDPEFEQDCEEYQTAELVTLVYNILQANKAKCQLPFDDNLPKKIKDALKNNTCQDLLAEDQPLRAELIKHIDVKKAALSKKIADNVNAILSTKSFVDLCHAGVVVNKDVPGCGVDINISLWKGNTNHMYSPNPVHNTSPLFWCIAAASIMLIGRDTGSLLPSTQSYDPATYLRMGQARLAASALAAVTQSKAQGGCLKRSPPTIAENPARAADHEFDRISSNTIRLERREGEPGGGLGEWNEAAQLHYALSALLAVRNGLRMMGTAEEVKSWDHLLSLKQPFNTSHEDALMSFSRSSLLKEGYGPQLHQAVCEHAKLAIAIKQQEMASVVVRSRL